MARRSRSADRNPRPWLRDLGTLGIVLALLAAVSLLPPDTSLSEVQKGGILRACVPPDNPPLVRAGDADLPGIDVEILSEIARELDLRLILNPNAAIGRELDPRAWRISRANCHILAGGIATNDLMRSFMQVTDPHLATGWAVISPGPLPGGLQGQDVGVHVGMIGRDRIALSRALREAGATIHLEDTESALSRGITSGRYQAGVADAVLAGGIAAREGWQVTWLTPGGQEGIGIALWKGDMTLVRRVERILDAMRSDGRLDAILARYSIQEPEGILLSPQSEG